MLGRTFLVVVSEELALIIVLTEHSALLQARNTTIGSQGVVNVSFTSSVVAGTGHWGGTSANTNQEHEDSQNGGLTPGYLHVFPETNSDTVCIHL